MKPALPLFVASLFLVLGCNYKIDPLGSSDHNLGPAPFAFKGRITDCATGRGLPNVIVSCEAVNDGMLFGFREPAGSGASGAEGYFEFTPTLFINYKFYTFDFAPVPHYFHEDYASLSSEDISKSGGDIDLGQAYAPYAHLKITFTNTKARDTNDLIAFEYKPQSPCRPSYVLLEATSPRPVYEPVMGYKGIIQKGQIHVITTGGALTLLQYTVYRNNTVADSGAAVVLCKLADTTFYHIDY